MTTHRPVPADLYLHVEPEAGEVLPVTRWRPQEEFCPNWDYICSPRASREAVVAALYCTRYVSEGNWSRALHTHAPDAIALLDREGKNLRQYCQGDISPGLGTRVDATINEALGYEVVVLFPAGDVGPDERADAGRRS